MSWQLIMSKLPDLSNLRTFGCPTYAHIDQSRRNKFDDKFFKGIFIGYAFESPAWLTYNPVTQRVTRTRSVVFDEEWKSTTPVSSTISPSTNIEDDYITDDEDTPIPWEQQPAVDPPAEPEPVIPTPGEQQLATDQLPPTKRSMRRAARLLKDLAAAKLRMERERRAKAARLAHEARSSENATIPSEPIPPAAAVGLAESTSY
jgi:hypothetical protein